MGQAGFGEKYQNIAAKTDLTLGGAEVNPQGIWAVQWETMKNVDSEGLAMQIAPASATILRYYPAK